MPRLKLSRVSASRLSASVLVLAGAASLVTTGCGSGIIGAAVPASTTTAAPSAVQSGPQLGYIWSEQTRTLRPVLGIAGSSLLGQSVVPADLYVGGASSSLSNLAILQETDGVLDLMVLPSGAPTRLTANVAAGAEIRFSPSGQNAIAFVAGSQSVTLLGTLTGTPQISTVTFPGALAEAVVSDNRSIAAAIKTSAGMTVRTISVTGASNAAGTVASLGGLVFEAAGDDLLLADAQSNSLTLVRSSVTAPSSSLIQSANLLKTPQGVGVSRDGRFAVLANTGDTNIVRLDLTAQTAPQSFACNCQPALVAQLSGSGVFRVTSADSGPTWMLDASVNNPRVLFIPASKVDPAAAGKN